MLLILFILTVPFVSQEGAGANLHKYDCGAAVAAMLIQYVTGTEVTVNSLVEGLEDTYQTSWSIEHMVNSYDIELQELWFHTPDVLRSHLEQGPVMFLVGYQVLQSYESKDAQHWILIVGYDNEDIIYHDPEVGPNQRIHEDLFFAALDRTELLRTGFVIKEFTHEKATYSNNNPSDLYWAWSSSWIYACHAREPCILP